jgi:Ca2+-binding EF-hand superfamily protein
MGTGVSDLEVDEMIQEVDSGDTGRISFVDFLKYWRELVASDDYVYKYIYKCT